MLISGGRWDTHDIPLKSFEIAENLPLYAYTVFRNLIAARNSPFHRFSPPPADPFWPEIWPIPIRDYLPKWGILETYGLPTIFLKFRENCDKLPRSGDTIFWTLIGARNSPFRNHFRILYFDVVRFRDFDIVRFLPPADSRFREC